MSLVKQVFAGLLEPEGTSPSAKIIRALDDQRKKEPALMELDEDATETLGQGQIVPLELDTTREDSLHACLDAVRARLPAGEDGKGLHLIWESLFMKELQFHTLSRIKESSQPCLA